MERHILSECRGKQEQKDLIKRKKETGEMCWKKNCPKILFAKIRCEVSGVIGGSLRRVYEPE